MIHIFLTASFSTQLLNLNKSTGRDFNLSTFKSSISAFKLVKSAILANFDISRPVAVFYYEFLLHH